MMYDIKAIPSLYNGVQFRSRLEARWAAFFDLCGWHWDYEPIDLPGWAPDFSLRTPHCRVFVEVKPVDQGNAAPFAKAAAHYSSVQVMLCGVEPYDHFIGSLMDRPSGATYDWADLNEYLSHPDARALWREAGNLVQWLPWGIAS